MRCSSCSEVVKPVVALDIDGTLADYYGAFHRFAADWLGTMVVIREKPYDGSIPYRDWVSQNWNIDHTTFRRIKLAFRQGGSKRKMPAYLGAGRLAYDLRKMGAEVWITTTRPHERFDRVDPDTVEWLRRNHIEYDGLLFGDNKMTDLAERVDSNRVAAVLDDLPAVLNNAQDLGWHAVKRATEYNRGWRWADAVADLSQANYRIQELVNEWKDHR